MNVMPVQAGTAPISDAPAAAGGVRLATLTLIRWGAVLGQAVTLLVVHFGLGFALPIVPAFSVVGASVLLNLLLMIGGSTRARLKEGTATLLLAFDVVQLALLLYLTGGLGNPFVLLLLAPLTVSATILSLRSTAMLCGLALVVITVLAVAHLPLPWTRAGFAPPETYILGVWVAMALGIGFFASYTWRVAEEARRMSNALAATQLALAREQRLSAVGGLAAAAAHELGSPLGTIAVVTRELARDLPPDSPLTGDVQLLLSEAARCGDILARLGQTDEGGENGPDKLVPVDAVVEAAAGRQGTEEVRLSFEAGADESRVEAAAPLVRNSPEIIHGIGNLVQNAVQFARHEVRVVTRWNASEIRVIVEDDGPGIPSRVLERLGEPYVSTRTTGGNHMGLGIFIAQTLLQHTGARLEFHNRPQGGTRVVVIWPRAALEAPASAAGR